MKKILCVILSFVLLLLAGCSDSRDSGHTTSSTSDTNTQSADPTSTTAGTTTGNHNATGTTTTTTTPAEPACSHTDTDSDNICDLCNGSVIVYFDFYAINDLHGKLADADDHPGVDELSTYLKDARENDENAIFLSTGDMWQGSPESNMTKGMIMTEWMNALDFTAMAIGNHEFDWGEEYVAANAELAEFPFLAINIYDRSTQQPSSFCSPSVIVDADGLQIGIIGAIGDCYSSIAVDKCDEVYFKVGNELTELVKDESIRLRNNGVDFIVYIIHDGYGRSQSGQVTSSQIASYYNTTLSDGYVDLVFEGHTHQGYRILDEHGVYHLQNRGDNKGGISHAEISINAVTQEHTVHVAELISTSAYQSLDDDPIVGQLLDKYAEQISPANRVLGYNSRYRSSSELLHLAARLYYETGVEMWGSEYDIVLGGGFMSARSPYNLYTGEVIYGDLQAILPFDNQILLCSIKGSDLISKFLETDNDRYYIHCGEYGNSIRDSIDRNAVYYVVTDSYSAYYKSNRLTVVEEYDPTVFARDLIAEYVENGGFS